MDKSAHGIGAGANMSLRFMFVSQVPDEGLNVAHIRTGDNIHLPKKLVGVFCVVTMADNAEQNYGWQDILFEHEKVIDLRR